MKEGNIVLRLNCCICSFYQKVASAVFFCVKILLQDELIICYFYSIFLIRLGFALLWQELLYLYGFVVENNPDDYLMVILSNTVGILDNISTLFM